MLPGFEESIFYFNKMNEEFKKLKQEILHEEYEKTKLITLAKAKIL